MLHFFPCTFPDETLYSRLARYHRLSGHSDDRDSLHQLVGVHTHVVTSNLPSLLQTLVSRIPTDSRPSVDEIISTNTIFPYFQGFLPPERRDRAIAAMAGHCTSGLKTAIGLVASRLGAKNTFRFCRNCICDDQSAFGQAYWHRVHQLPGVWVCPRHAQVLWELDFKTVQLKRHKLFLPDEPIVELASKPISLSPFEIEAVLRIALLSTSVLSAPPASFDNWSLNDLHRESARRNGLVRDNGRIRVEELARMLRNYSSAFPATGEYAIVHQYFLEWVLRLLRRPRGCAIHPMKHLLLMDCLRGEKLQCFENRVRNPAREVAQNECQHQINQAGLIELLKEKRVSLRRAAAELGRSVTTLGVEAARLGLLVRRRPKNITEDVKHDVCASLQSGCTPKEVAERHGLSQVSVYRILRMDIALSREYKDHQFQQRRDARRKRFVSQTSSHADYIWLYRNDRQWLTTQQASAVKHEVQREPYIDWAGRDKLLAQKIIEISDTMLSAAGRPRWISRSALERETGLADTIERNADKLPITHVTLSTRSESHEEYQRRRLYWAAGELNKSLHGPPPRWQLLREAGIRVLAESNEKLVETLTLYRPPF